MTTWDSAARSSPMSLATTHADCTWKQVGPCVWCDNHGIRLYQGELPEHKRTVPRCNPDGHDWDMESGFGFYSQCRTDGLTEWHE